jgi:MIP family channel proteins
MEIANLLHKSSMEFLSTMMFHIIGSIAPTAVANGIALMVIVYYSAKISGGHINPAVSLTFFVLGHINFIELLAYIVSQMTGAMTGALILVALLPNVSVGETIAYDSIIPSGCFTPNPILSNTQVLFWEFVFTTVFIIPIFSVVWYTQNKSGYGNTGPIIVGLSLLCNALACGPYTGASFNPARSIGSYTVFKCPYKRVEMYIIGEFLGGLCAALFIMPWYGISATSWYATSQVTQYLTSGSSRNLEIRTA